MSEQEAAPAAAIPGARIEGQAELDASFAAAFLEHDPDDGGGADEPAETDAAPVRDEEGKFTSRAAAGVPKIGERDDADGAAEDDEGAEQVAGGDEAAVAAKPEDAEAYEKALLALRYSGVPSAIIKNASREELIAWGTEAADRRAKTEAALEERATRIRELEEGQKAPAAAPAKAAAPDWTPHLKALADTLGLDSEAATKAFGPVLDAVASTVRAEFEGRLSPIERATQDANAAEGRRQISEQVRRLAVDHPKLKTDQDLVQKLNAKALALWKSGEYRDAESVYDDASKLVLGAPTANLAAKRRNGSAAPPEGRMHEAMESSDEALLTAMDRSESGDSRGARRAGSQFWDQEFQRRNGRTPK